MFPSLSQMTIVHPTTPFDIIEPRGKSILSEDCSQNSQQYEIKSNNLHHEGGSAARSALKKAVINSSSALTGVSLKRSKAHGKFQRAPIVDPENSDTAGRTVSLEVSFNDLYRKVTCIARRESSGKWSNLADDISTSVNNEQTISSSNANNLFINLHSLGENEDDPKEKTNLQRKSESAMRVFLEPSSTPSVYYSDTFENPKSIQPSLRQDVFVLSSVFDIASNEDTLLFGEDKVDRSEDNANLTRPESLNHGQSDDVQKSGTHREVHRGIGALADREMNIGDTLDALLESGDGEFGEAPIRQARGSKLNSVRSRVTDQNAWSREDTVDVSEFETMVVEMAIEYPFDLDTFQRRAIYRLERDESVFVAAHTSAGKTVVAEYAIALARRRRTKVVYTSPIKTLSNQKYRDFLERFGDVGIITGDVSINPEASCLIMTTEILRSMLYKGADLIRDLSHVIFDECHWLNDAERGVVWEEAIILLPQEVSIVMLSATVPNAREFASWVGRTKQRMVYVIMTHRRPVPLCHSVFVGGQIFPLLESSKGVFQSANFKRALELHKSLEKKANIRFGGGRNHTWMPLIKHLRKNQQDPAIFFCFSKKRCDSAAEQLQNQDLTESARDKNHIHLFYQSSIARLSAEDRNVPQISRYLDLLKRGIGVHHAGVLPIIKEITEVLFQRGLVRILFATETFAMGVNMPARTVVFTSISKFDGRGQRLLEPGEYIQMAGRAGRRGLDEVGTVIMFPVLADFPSEPDIKSVLVGYPKLLKSQFRLTYNMILNILRIDELRVEDVMSRSFGEAPAGRNMSEVSDMIKNGDRLLKSMKENGAELDSFRGFYNLHLRLKFLSKRLGIMISSGKNAVAAVLSPGRVLCVLREDGGVCFAVVLKAPYEKKRKGSLGLKNAGNYPERSLYGESADTGSGLALHVMCLHGGNIAAESSSPFFEAAEMDVDNRKKASRLSIGGLSVELCVVPLRHVVAVTQFSIQVDTRALLPIRGSPSPTALSSTAESLREIAESKENWQVVPVVHPRKDMKLDDLDAEELWVERQDILSNILGILSTFRRSGLDLGLRKALERLNREDRLTKKIEKLKMAVSDESLELMPDYEKRLEVLERLGYVEGTAVRLKGRAACEVNTCGSLILTELVFENILQGLSAVDMAALLSSLVFQEGGGKDDDGDPREALREESSELFQATEAMINTLWQIGTAQEECGLPISPGDYVQSSVNFGLCSGVRAWAQGKPFAEVCQIAPSVAEGTIVRTVVRLSELLREAKNVGRVVGESDIQRKSEDAITLIKRDVIFAASLYIQ